MNIQVESPEELGSLSIKMLIKDAASDLNLTRIIDEVRVHVILDPLLCYISVIRNPAPPSVDIKDFLTITDEDDVNNVLKMEITDEMYAPNLLQLLWDKFGEDNVNQIRRNILEVNAKKDEIMSLPVHGLKEKEMNEKVFDLVQRIVPIGLRIIKKMPGELAYLASEDSITEEGIKMIKEAISRPPKELTITEEDFMPRKSTEKN